MPKRRWWYLEHVGEPAPFPDITGYDFVLEAFLEAGPAMQAGMGPSSLTFSEIAAWSAMTDSPLKPDEAKALRAMSKAYVQEVSESNEKDTPQPYRQDEEPTE